MAKDTPSIIDGEGEKVSPLLAPQEAPLEAEQYVLILPGETIDSLAEKYGTTPDAIIKRNQLNPDALLPYQGIFV